MVRHYRLPCRAVLDGMAMPLVKGKCREESNRVVEEERGAQKSRVGSRKFDSCETVEYQVSRFLYPVAIAKRKSRSECCDQLFGLVLHGRDRDLAASFSQADTSRYNQYPGCSCLRRALL